MSTTKIEDAVFPQTMNLPFGSTAMQVSGEEIPPFCLNRNVFSKLIHQDLNVKDNHCLKPFKGL